jgi:hypothetical protein
MITGAGNGARESAPSAPRPCGGAMYATFRSLALRN